MKFQFILNAKGHIRHRESGDLEFKESFHFESIPFYLRSIVAMANNKGGQIIFGIKNSPHLPVGLKNDKFQKCDPKEINEKVSEYFSYDFSWHIETLEFGDMTFGQLWVPEANSKPILCKKNNDKCKLREGAIYYRYRGETKEIAYAELYKLIEGEKEKEKRLWMEHIQKITLSGPRNIHILDTYTGELEVGQTKLLIDKDLLSKIKFIKEGSFTEKAGAPALVLKGEVSGILDHNQVISSDDLYPLFTRNLEQELGLNQHEVKCLVWKLKIKGDRRYHNSTITGTTSQTHKYSKNLLEVLKRVTKKEGFVKIVCKEFSEAHPSKGRSFKKGTYKLAAKQA